jgi:RND family efflux transporter MFP subunit
LISFAGSLNRAPRHGTWISGIGLLVLVGQVSGCRRAETKPPPPKPAEVFVANPVNQQVTEYAEFTGQLQAPETVEIRARVSGYLDKVSFKDGDLVKEGSPLFKIDPRPYQAEVNRSTAAFLQSQARQDRLQRQEDRARDLLKKGAMAAEAYDQIKFDLAEAKGGVEAAAANKELAELNLSFTNINARISGRISRRMVDPGNLVRADETQLTTIVSIDPLDAYFDIDEQTVLRLRRLQQNGKLPNGIDNHVRVDIALADEKNQYSLSGHIDFTDNRVDSGTGTLRARAVVKNPKQLLAPGMFVHLKMPVGPPRPALLIREEALGTDQGQRFVYVVNDKNEVVYRPVKVGWPTKGLMVIEEGVTAEDRVIVTGLQRVRPGAKVDPKPATDSSASVKVGANSKATQPGAMASGKTSGGG